MVLMKSRPRGRGRVVRQARSPLRALSPEKPSSRPELKRTTAMDGSSSLAVSGISNSLGRAALPASSKRHAHRSSSRRKTPPARAITSPNPRPRPPRFRASARSTRLSRFRRVPRRPSPRPRRRCNRAPRSPRSGNPARRHQHPRPRASRIAGLRDQELRGESACPRPDPGLSALICASAEPTSGAA